MKCCSHIPVLGPIMGYYSKGPCKGHIYPHGGAQVFHATWCRKSHSSRFGQSSGHRHSRGSQSDFHVGALSAFGVVHVHPDRCSNWEKRICPCRYSFPIDMTGTACTGLHGTPEHPWLPRPTHCCML